MLGEALVRALGRAAGQVLDVDRPQGRDLDAHAARAGRCVSGYFGFLAHGAVHRERRGLGTDQRVALQHHRAAAVVEAGLVDRHALEAQRLVDLDGGIEGLAGVGIGHLHLAREAAGHAGRVVIDHELLEPERERHGLHQGAVAHHHDRGAGLAALGHQHAGAKARVVHRQAPAFGHLGDQHVLDDGLFAAEHDLQPHRQFAVEQPADADDDQRRVREHIAQPVGAALLGRQQHAVLVLAFAHRVSQPAQQLLQAGRGLRHVGGGVRFHPVGEGAQAADAHVLAKRTRVAQHLGRVADQADRGRHDQERHDQQEPPAVVDVPDRELVEHFEPERAELVDVIAGRAVLLQHRSHQARHADEHQQADGKTHRAQQFEEIAGQGAQGGTGMCTG